MHRRLCATVLVGRSSLLRDGLSHILCAAESSFRIIASAAKVDDLVWGPIEQDQPVLLIIDAGSDPEAMTHQIATFKEQQPSGRVAVLADQYLLPWVLAAFQAGANAYLLKVVESDAFIKALELVDLGQTILPPELLSYIRKTISAVEAPAESPGPEAYSDSQLPPDFNPKLSCREEHILRYIGEGCPNKIIARQMGIAEGTVKVHVKAILRKIRVGNRTQAAIWLKDHPKSTPACNLAQLGSTTPTILPADCSEAALATGVSKIGSVFSHPSPH